ncbi:bifunctional diguanylate cyclase/phosphodiesterase [Novosphingobium naphthalenivorans]|uniref:bifunctional diguanylate cyclase/phosphodiesterase n=1 Tax=Novosphingobium naphthalenivorans TaxID=273168 RepID=UPI00083157FD|nr:EAL domain-containing protein [Novosphingobium naphthalenivorans]
MLEILLCVRDEHDLRLVPLAAAVCLLTTTTAVLMLRQSSLSQRASAHLWTVMGGLATGFGIWATHFIAMLGYDPGFIAGYKVGLTLGSLLIVLMSTVAAFVVARHCRTAGCLIAASVIAGGGFAAMHYVGMAALEMPARIQWQASYVGLSVALAIVPLYPALFLVVRGKAVPSGLAAALIMAVAVVGLHFTGMTAIHLIPSHMHSQAMLMSPRTMSVVIGTVSVALLALCIAAWLAARRTRAAVAASERQLSILVKGISDCAIYMLDRSGRVANWNAGAQRLEGYDIDEVLGMPFECFYTEEDRMAGLPEKALSEARDCGKFSAEGWRVRKDGSRFWAHFTIERIQGEDGKLLGFVKITRDMTRFKQDQDRIEEASGNLDAALENMQHGLCLFDAEERLVLRNRRFAELWNLPEDSCLPGWALTDIIQAALSAKTGMSVTSERVENARLTLLDTLRDPSLPPIVSEYGTNFIVSVSSRQLPDGRWVATFEDITERRRSEEQIAHMALHDGLTGMPNRASFNRWLDKEIEFASVRGQQVALVAIDLDRFKEINDSQGHAAGDRVLQSIAGALTESARDGEIVARLGGDEFAAAKYFSDTAELADFVARLNACFEIPHGAQDGIAVGASLGIAVYPADAQAREPLLNNADLAMYRAKSSLDEHICYYEHGMDESARYRRQLANDLRQAVARGELHILYQPQRSLKTNQVSGFEALLRWQHPRLGIVSPVEFIPIAEETGEIVRIGEWVLRMACAEAAQWGHDQKIAVNLSPVQLLKANLPELVASILLETGLSARRLELEITESAIIADKARALHSLRKIKSLGVSVAMDDFGTGYSSLDTLHSFPFDKIKIDKSFLLRSETNEQARAIIRAVLALGKSLNIPVLAEGVETKGQLALLIGEGCDEAQGYYFGHPAPAPSAGSALEVAIA